MTVAAVAREVGVYQRRMVHRRLGRLPEKHSNTQQEIAKKKPDAAAFKATASAPVDASGELDELEGEVVSRQ